MTTCEFGDLRCSDKALYVFTFKTTQRKEIKRHTCFVHMVEQKNLLNYLKWKYSVCLIKKEKEKVEFT